MKVKKYLLTVVMLLGVMHANADNIVFADKAVKQLCIDKWDTDSDGELSTEEAKAVKSLGNVFRGNKTIATFDELCHFTGLTAIDDYAFYQSSIQSVSFPETATYIGEYAFCQSSISGELRVPGSVKDIGDFAFNKCLSLTGIILEEGVETVGWHTFSGPIKTLSLPSSLTYMSSMAVDPYASSLPQGDVLYVYVHSASPVNIDTFAFYPLFSEGHLVVPFGTTEAYKAVEGWSHFGEYLEYGDVNMDGYVNNRDVISTRAYILGNNPSPFHEKMADVNGDGTINNRDVILLRNNVMR